jgi:hypothetical protein
MKNYAILLFISVILITCNKNDEIAPQEKNFYALSVGNSWVYKNYEYNSSLDDYEYLGITDSVSIIDNEIIKGEIYYKFRRMTIGNEKRNTFCNVNGEHISFLRDSLGFLINNEGHIKYANNNFDERQAFVVAPNMIAFEKLLEETKIIDTEAGSFECLITKRYARQTDNGEIAPALDYRYYSDGIGLVSDTQSYLANNKHFVIRRLDSFSIK